MYGIEGTSLKDIKNNSTSSNFDNEPDEQFRIYDQEIKS
jgi:hypothetical protein